MNNSQEKFSYALPVNKLVNTLIMRHFIKLVLTLNPIRPGGGGGLRGPDGQTHSCQSETSYPMMPELGDF